MNLTADDNPYAPPTVSNPVGEPVWPEYGETKFLVVPRSWQSPPVCLLTGATDGLQLFQRTGISYWLSRPVVGKLRFRALINGLLAGLGLLPVSASFLPGVGSYRDLIIMAAMFLGLPFILASALLAKTWCQPILAWRIRDGRVRIAGIPAPVWHTVVQMDQVSGDPHHPGGHVTGHSNP